MKKNDYFIGECVDQSHDGKGIIKYEGFTYFVNGMITGEVGQIKCIKMLKNYGVGRLIELQKPSPERVNPKCHIYQGCGGCHLMHLSSKGQQEFKTKRVKDCMERIGHLEVDVQPCLMQENPWYYRNKVQMPLGYDKNGQLVTGFYKQKTNDIIACNECLIQNEESNAVIQRVKELFVEYNIKPYDKVTHRGNIKHILTKKGYHSEEFMLCFITYQKTIKHIDQIVEILIQEFPHIKTIIQNINDRHDNVILGDEEKILYGKGYIYDTLLDNQYKISLKSFYQINPIQVEKLYQTAIDLAHINQDSVVLDAYCGIGTITLSLAKHVKKVYGVEVVPQAIEDAKNNALLNKIDNADFVCDDAGKYMVDLVKKNTHLDVVFVDPPRKGCSEEFLEHLLQANPKEIIYISCDVATQARDAKYLNEHGYTITHCQPVDMFPHTFHIENILRFEKTTDR
ncbi:23S rRNA (uracil-C(5))-methyltransferase RlmCD [Faecalibacillus intestinalis]|uniref:23S rRNA (Uracil-C(5))-methyltransferase RlmCD n=1 Tax=Faecalibacillus intestinalis TaxID=1982626 RepID=A0A7I8E314_9FIRM|nr:23S rRNA (uracil(1939)-C(5))-methyltransferase RlmD [Faecalibacillus intestinalis]BCL58150.1 23S rRNA (uracil-C(5))-methyltransferase RlmCD [Faecalibacillus intestinalis]